MSIKQQNQPRNVVTESERVSERGASDTYVLYNKARKEKEKEKKYRAELEGFSGKTNTCLHGNIV